MSAPDLSLDDWLSLRRKSIGASEAAAACSEDPNVSPLELVCRKRGQIPDPDLSDVEAVQWGKILEPTIVAESARRAKLELVARAIVEDVFERNVDTELVGWVEGRQPFLRSRARPWQTATPDGIAFDSSDGSYVAIEAKNQGQYRSSAWDTEDGRAPEKFQIQVAHQLAVAPALAGGLLGGLVGGNSLRTLRLERTKIAGVIEAVTEIEGRVWRCVETGDMPELSGPSASVARALKALHPDDNGESVVLPETLLETAKLFEEAKAKRDEWKDRADELKVRLSAAIGAATFGVMPNGAGVYSLKTIEKASYQVRAQKYRELRFKAAK